MLVVTKFLLPLLNNIILDRPVISNELIMRNIVKLREMNEKKYNQLHARIKRKMVLDERRTENKICKTNNIGKGKVMLL